MPSDMNDGSEAEGWPSRKLLGVNASKSSGLSVTGVNGRAFKACSTRQRVVANVSSVSLSAPRVA